MTETTDSARRLAELYADIRDDLDRVETELAGLVRSDNPLTREIGAYLFAAGGKRIRPALLTLSARLAGGGGGPETAFWSAVVEIIHAASLVHDDIIDRTDTRRGRETVHARWGANITVLLGDHLYIRAVHRAVRTRRYDLVEAIAEATEKMIDGEMAECAVGGDPGLSEERHLEILENKTAALFAAACRIGGILGGAGPDLADRLDAYGRNLGLAFQIVDDLLDFTGRPETLGKPVLTDLREGRITLPVIAALRRTDGPGRAALLAGIEQRAVERVRDAVFASGAIPEVAARAAGFARRAKAALPEGSPSAAARTLSLLADFILERSV